MDSYIPLWPRMSRCVEPHHEKYVGMAAAGYSFANLAKPHRHWYGCIGFHGGLAGLILVFTQVSFHLG